ncbi:hypothetical protein [Nocardioides sp. CFH 31398]|uniref:hypothetical protein n=1 Tax=Nocardioides sp. CFH 31398 TaxID=2919579 RepID=UPI001F06FD33|nr:hypothetical protein [Nocardioides sp. CFH 31398]MCH1868386.1 hypothetical protein [Nocardioides sp. CFH 31398]
MTPPIDTPPTDGRGLRTGRRGVLKGLGALAVAPAALTVLGDHPAHAADPDPRVDARGYEEVSTPSCLADLIEMGVVGRGDLVAG